MITCEKCNGRVIEDLIDYETTIYGEKVVIPKVDGFRCLECGNTKIDENILSGLQNKLLKKKLEIQKKKQKLFKPLLINNIRSIRESKMISQKEIGEALGYQEQRFGAIERNDNTPLILTAKLMADALEVKVEELYDAIYVSNEFYDIVKNLSAIEIKDEFGNIVDYDFIEIPELIEVNQRYSELEYDIKDKMAEIRKLKKADKFFLDIKKTEKEVRELMKNKGWEKDQETALLVEKKNERIKTFMKSQSVLDIENKEIEVTQLKKEKNQVLAKRRTIENTKNCILKQSQCLDGKIFEKLKDIYKEDYKVLY